MDFLKELNEMRQNFSQNKKKMSLPEPPFWMKYSDKMADAYRYGDEIIRDGNVYYGNIVQANMLLFDKAPLKERLQRGSGNPAAMIYSCDPYANQDPFYLQGLARYIYSFKDDLSVPVPAGLEEIVALVRDEYSRSDLHFSIETKEIGRIDASFIAIMIIRSFLPKGYLISNILPIIVAPEYPADVILLPMNYWTKDFKKAWIEGRF